MRNHLNKTTGSRVLVALAVVGLVLGASACGGGKKSATTTTSSGTSATEQWASGVCTAFADWKAGLNDAKSTLTSAGLTDANLNQAAGEAQAVNQQLVRSLQTLGAPHATDGQKAKLSINDLKTSLSFAMNKIEDTLKQTASTPAELAAEVTTVKQAVNTMYASLETAVGQLKQYDPSGELEQAFHNAPSCSGMF